MLRQFEHGGSPSELFPTSTPLLVASVSTRVCGAPSKRASQRSLSGSRHYWPRAVNAVAVGGRFSKARRTVRCAIVGSTPLYTAAPGRRHRRVAASPWSRQMRPMSVRAQGVTPLLHACMAMPIVRSLVKNAAARAAPQWPVAHRRPSRAITAAAVLEAPLGDVEDLDSTRLVWAAIGAPSSSLSVSSAAMRSIPPMEIISATVRGRQCCRD